MNMQYQRPISQLNAKVKANSIQENRV